MKVHTAREAGEVELRADDVYIHQATNREKTKENDDDDEEEEEL